MNKPLLIIFASVPGSGKTTFARQLSKKLRIITLNSDALRVSMWGSVEQVMASRSTADGRNESNELTFGALDYIAEQLLASGQSVIYDNNQNTAAIRRQKRSIADKHGAITVVVRMKVPYEVSLHRMQYREAAPDSRQVTLEQARLSLDQIISELNEPQDDELSVVINGEDSFEDQYRVFCGLLRRIGYELE